MRLSISLALLLVPSVTSAQGAGGVANSGMSQGEARISSRSDIRLSMESMPGTSGTRVSALGSRVGRRMAQVRACYTETISEHPTVTGTLRLRILLDGDGAPTIEVERNDTHDSGLATCISGALGGLDHDGLSRPTHAVVQLEFANSAAHGAERAARRAREARQVSVQVDADGDVTSSGGT
ncbi:MAG TPA: hypothetical protein ENK57_14145, partial [Polyangiaceae bacterium]|nr:hypothetical protein [Polyangiaceae bacterium]